MKNQLCPWSTWDIKSINAVMHLHSLLEVKIGVFNDFDKAYVENLHPSRHVNRYGLHAADGSYFQIEYKVGEFAFSAEFAGEGDSFVVKLTPLRGSADIFYYISAHLMWNGEGTVIKEGDRLCLAAREKAFSVRVCAEIDSKPRFYFSAPGILARAENTVYIFCNRPADFCAADAMLSAGKNKALEAIGENDPQRRQAAEAIYKVMTWNTVYDPVNDRMITPVTRLWCLSDHAEFAVFGSYVLFCWDTFFNGLLAGVFDKELAYNQVYSILSEATDRGMIPNTNAHRKKSLDRSQPPVGAWCVWKLYEQFGEKEFLEKTFNGLYAWNRYWFRYRDRNCDGLLEWGSDPFPDGYRSRELEKMNYAHSLAAAKLESGLDNSPMYDEVSYDPSLCTMDLCDVGLNALYALDLMCLAKIAGELGNKELQQAMSAEYETMKKRINGMLWNEELGIYCNRFWDGRFSDALSPTCFYPLLAGIPDARQAQRMVDEHLWNEAEFWGDCAIPSTPRNSPAFGDDKYWRGRIWAPMNYLVFEGLRQFGFHSQAEQLAEKGSQMFLRQWEENQIISENYHPDGTAADDPFYTWGALFAYMKLCI